MPGCKGLWTVYHKNTRSHSVDSAKMGLEDDEYHAYLIISLETRTMVITYSGLCLKFGHYVVTRQEVLLNYTDYIDIKFSMIVLDVLLGLIT